MTQFSSRLTFVFYSLVGLSLSTTVHAAGSCEAILTQGIYNVTSSTSSSEGETLAKSQFCQNDYSLSSTSEKSSISASFLSYFSFGTSGTESELIQKQKQVCTLGFNSTKYSNSASSYSRTIYQGAVDAWSQCNALSGQGVKFEFQPDNTNLGVAASFIAATGTTAKFYGLTQTGLGTSTCKYLGNTVMENYPIALSSASKVTILCSRNTKQDSNGNYFVDDQTLFFNTSAGAFQIPLKGTAMLSRVTLPSLMDTVKTEVAKNVQALTPANLPVSIKLTNGTVYQNTSKRKYLITYTYGGNVTGLKVLKCVTGPTSTLVDGMSHFSSTNITQTGSGTGESIQTSCVVPAGYYYRFTWNSLSGAALGGVVWEIM